jgi:hypothetical protein
MYCPFMGEGNTMTECESGVDMARVRANFTECYSSGNELCAQCYQEFVRDDEILEGTSISVAGAHLCDAICATDYLDVGLDVKNIEEWEQEQHTTKVEGRDPVKAAADKRAMMQAAWDRLEPPAAAPTVAIRRPTLAELRAERDALRATGLGLAAFGGRR